MKLTIKTHVLFGQNKTSVLTLNIKSVILALPVIIEFKCNPPVVILTLQTIGGGILGC